MKSDSPSAMKRWNFFSGGYASALMIAAWIASDRTLRRWSSDSRRPYTAGQCSVGAQAQAGETAITTVPTAAHASPPARIAARRRRPKFAVP
jgi:hypothetical protein